MADFARKKITRTNSICPCYFFNMKSLKKLGFSSYSRCIPKKKTTTSEPRNGEFWGRKL